MNRYAFVPMPMTAHPSLERYADGVRGLNQQDSVRIPRIRFTNTFADQTDEPTSVVSEYVLLRNTKFAGAAPFIGDPRVNVAWYFWPVWRDEAGRWIAGEARLEWIGHP